MRDAEALMPILHGGMLRDAFTAALHEVDRRLSQATSEVQRIHRESVEANALLCDLDDPNRDEYHALTQRQTVVRKALGEFDGPDVSCTCRTREIIEPCLLHGYSDAGLR